MDDLPQFNKAVPADFHPATLTTKGHDDLPTRAGVSGLTALYNTWATLADTEAQLTNKAKLSQIAAKETHKALEKSEAVVKHLNEVEKNLTKAISNAITAKRTRYDAELRAHYKGKPGEALKDAAANPEIAAALYDVPAVLLGYTPEQTALLRERIEMAHAEGDFNARASARRASAKLATARERFGSVWMGKMSKWANSDDAVLAKIGAA